MIRPPIGRLALATLALVATLQGAAPPAVDLAGALRWRSIGPHRGGRTKAAAGVPARPNVFYIGVCNGGVWRTTDHGRTWTPIFDAQPTGSIGALALAPSNPDIVYAGSGEGLQRPDLSTGDGIYRSSDGGRTWIHLGLRDGQQIPQIVVDPRDPNRLFVAVLGHPYGPNAERGIFRSTDGGASFQKVLYRDPDTGGVDVVLDPADPDVVYAVLWESRLAPWENGVFSGPGSGLYKSTDGGASWRPLTRGLPKVAGDGLGRIGITVAPSDPRRLYATVEASRNGGLYRSDDAGESWSLACADPRVTQRASDFAEVKVHPRNPDVVFSASVVVWKSSDGGRSFTAFRGAPGGDDYHRIWINPEHPEIMLLASDQGAIVTVNGGATWSSWYNQPTGQFYHVATDNAFPYRVCGGQQESGSACVSSRGDSGQITFRDWHPVGVEEYGYVAADPLDPDVVYGGKLTRFDRRTGQTQEIAPQPLATGDYRVLRTQPVVFSPLDPRALLFASNVVWKSGDGGRSWAAISPDLSRREWEVPPNVGKYAATAPARPSRRGVVYALAPSPLEPGRIWAGTDDGLIHLTTDGGRTWRDVTPPDLRPWAKVSVIEPSHFDRECAYAAVNTFRLDDLRPHVYRTRDGGRSWTLVTAGLPADAPVNAVREDPGRRGLLFAGTERAVHVSRDDGEHWQSLRLNMPATSIRDLVIKDDDLVVGTHGRSFWILDDISPLRQLDALPAAGGLHLFRPRPAWRVRRSLNTDTPLPQEEPAGQNPPDGAVLHYWLEQPASRVTLEIVDAAGAVVRRYASDDPPEALVAERNIPDYWIRPSRPLPASAGLHRFVWDVRHPPPAVLDFSYPIAAVFGDTPRTPLGSFALPGRYTVRLTADGRHRTQPLAVRLDPRVKSPAWELDRQHALSMRLHGAIARDRTVLDEVRRRRAWLAAVRELARGAALGDPLEALDRELAALEAETPAGVGLVEVNRQLARLLDIVQGADRAPTTQVVRAAATVEGALARLAARWEALRAGAAAAFDGRARAAGLPRPPS